ncbi:DUF222 domain-containing protein [Nocardiaceae bacterium YC2-7]|uniref:DUF222 domain-containing protein n=2 Tax=Antrihabitans stalactiti TaxID=2584121 RepID=A0A848K8U3_9NOCA|nr:DUF222 domain-containing protein [Antrihabitans stalactiti]
MRQLQCSQPWTPFLSDPFDLIERMSEHRAEWVGVTEIGLVEALRARHRAVAVAQAAEVFALTELYRRRFDEDTARGLNGSVAGQWAAVEAAAALRVSEAVANACLDLGLALESLPRTRAAFAVGDIDFARAKVIADLLVNLDPDLVAELEKRLAGVAGSCNPAKLRERGRRWIAAADPDGEKERRKRRTEDRDVRIRGHQDGMSYLDGLLPAAGAQALAARLTELAKQVCAHDPRTFAQRRADGLVALADGSEHLSCECGRDDCTANTDATAGLARRALIQVGVSLETLLGLADHPGFLAGYGAIDADLARSLAVDGRWEWIMAAVEKAVADSDTETETAAVTKMSKDDSAADADDPADDAEALRYAWTAKVSGWVGARDGTCRFPGCVRPAVEADTDHVERYDHDDPRRGGRTVKENAAKLCRRHHRCKTAGENGLNGWRVRQCGGGRLVWTTPTGEQVFTEPEGAKFLWPQPPPVAPKPRPQPPHVYVPRPGDGIVCSSSSMLEQLRFGRSKAEQQLVFLLEVRGVKPARRQPKSRIVYTTDDPEEPCPF